MAAPTVYRWDDAEAPVAQMNNTSMISLLRACLVDGYGEKQGAGFTLEYINAAGTIAAFRNNPITGTGLYLQVDAENYATAGSYYIQGYETMSSESVGLGPMSTYAHYAATGNSTTAGRPWILIADDRFFYFLVWESLGTAPVKTSVTDCGVVFGDIRTPEGVVDSFACIVGASLSTGLPFGTKTVSTISGPCSPYLMSSGRNEDGVYGPKGYPMIRAGGPCLDTVMGHSGPPYVPGGDIIYAQPWIGGTTTYSTRGVVPGLFHPCHPAAFDQFEEVTVVPHGKMLSLCSVECSNGASNIFISLEDWWT